MGNGPGEGGSPVSLKQQQSAGSAGTWRKRSLGKGAGEAEGKQESGVRAASLPWVGQRQRAWTWGCSLEWLYIGLNTGHEGEATVSLSGWKKLFMIK